MSRRWLTGLVVAVALCAWTQAASAGPVILAGHDADEHTCCSGAGFDAYVDLFDSLLAGATGGSGILAIGADIDTTAGDWIEAEAAAGTGSPTVTFVNGGDISTVDFSLYEVLHIPSDYADTFGGITADENALLTARADDIADFVNAGGGLFGLTQGGLVDAYGYITGAGGLGAITTLDVDPSGTLPSGEDYDDVTATAVSRTVTVA